MDEAAARGRKFAEQIRSAGWVLDADQSQTIISSGFWLYSTSLSSGPRLVGQLTVEGYRAMRSGELARVVGKSVNPVDLLGHFLQHYDDLPPDQRNRESSEKVTMALALYATCTQTLKQLPPLQGAMGQHFMVFDWKVRGGQRILRPAAAVHPVTLTPEQLGAFSEQVLAMHLQKAPQETPL